jgi:hypothetical protein
MYRPDHECQWGIPNAILGAFPGNGYTVLESCVYSSYIANPNSHGMGGTLHPAGDVATSYGVPKSLGTKVW